MGKKKSNEILESTFTLPPEMNYLLQPAVKPILQPAIRSSSQTDNLEDEISRFRTILPQVLAVSAKNMLLFDLGLSVAFPTIVIPALRGTLEKYSNETLRFTDVEASWFASIAFICQPLGSFFSGWITDSVGRKKSMIFVNIPYIVAWILFYYAYTHTMLYIGAILFGLAVGFMEAPIVTYVGEICQPSIRGTLMTFTNISVAMGVFTVYTLGACTNWRTTAMICFFVPILTVVAILFVPETPIWLLSKNRREEARKSLQWLRGWASPKAVREEFNKIEMYSRNANRCIDCQKRNSECDHPSTTLSQKLKELKRKKTLKPFLLVMGLFALAQFSGCLSMRPFMIQIFKAYKVPLDPSVATVYVGFVSLMGNIVCMATVRILGKRRVCLISFIGSFLCCTLLASYGFMYLPENYNSFTFKFNETIQPNVFPLIVFYLLCFWTYGGVAAAPWLFMSEVFPFKSRGFATGICAALNYILGFFSTKMYMNLDKGLCLSGVMLFFMTVNFVGLLFSFFLVPETENRTLLDIENHFSDNSKKMWNLKIEKLDKKDVTGNENV